MGDPADRDQGAGARFCLRVGRGGLVGEEGCQSLDASRNWTMPFGWWLSQDRKGRQRRDLPTRSLVCMVQGWEGELWLRLRVRALVPAGVPQFPWLLHLASWWP